MHVAYALCMSSLRDRRKITKTKREHLRPAPPLTLTLRTLTPLRRDTNVHYAGDVAVRRINREAWAAEIRRLIDEEAGGNRAKFSTLVGSSYKTVGRWLDQSVDVSEESVRAVARALHIAPMDLLVRVGYYQQSDLNVTPGPTPAEVAADPALRVIEDSDQPPRVKARMRERLYELRRQRQAAEVDEVKWWLDQAGEG